jgi:hypothetical protein
VRRWLWWVILAGLVTAGIVVAIVVTRGRSRLRVSAAPFSATVVDAATGEPLAGVIVVSMWEYQGGIPEPRRRGLLMVTEAVTDEKGRFTMPGWGPLSVPHWDESVNTLNPYTYAFKWDYARWLRANDPVRAHDDWAERRESNIDGMRIELQRVPRIQEIQRSEFSNETLAFRQFMNEMRLLFEYPTCDWQRTPDMWRHVTPIFAREELHAGEQPMQESLEYLAKKQGCGSFQDFVRDHR